MHIWDQIVNLLNFVTGTKGQLSFLVSYLTLISPHWKVNRSVSSSTYTGHVRGHLFYHIGLRPHADSALDI
jgi:hypothetical protein